MLKFFICCLFLSCVSHAQVGEVTSVSGANDAEVLRQGEKVILAEGTHLLVGDTVRTVGSQVSLLLYPNIQMNLVRGSELILSSHYIEETKEGSKTKSLVGLLKGMVRILVTKDQGDEVDQKVDAKEVTFAVRGTEYEVAISDEDADLDVVEGEVQVSSPHVQTFVPEIVKRGEGFRFDRKNKRFLKRQFRERIREARFLRKEALKERRMKRREMKSIQRQSKHEARLERKADRRERRNRGRKGP